MGDIYVHVRMKKCCRELLARIDEESKKANVKGGLFGVESLAALLGDKPIDAAMAAIPGGKAIASMGLDAEMEKVTRAICAKLCEAHAGEHCKHGELSENRFWLTLHGTFLMIDEPNYQISEARAVAQQAADKLHFGGGESGGAGASGTFESRPRTRSFT